MNIITPLEQRIITDFGLNSQSDTRIQCPVCQGKDKDLALKVAPDGRLMAHCHKDGCDFQEIKEKIAEENGFTESDQRPRQSQPQDQKKRTGKEIVKPINNTSLSVHEVDLEEPAELHPDIVEAFDTFVPYAGQPCAYAEAKRFDELNTIGLLYDAKHKSVIVPIESLTHDVATGYEYLNRTGKGGKGVAKHSRKNLGVFVVGEKAWSKNSSVILCEGLATALAVEFMIQQCIQKRIKPPSETIKLGKAADIHNMIVVCCFGSDGVMKIAGALAGAVDVFVYMDHDTGKHADQRKRNIKELRDNGIIAGYNMPQDANQDYWDVWSMNRVFPYPMIMNAFYLFRGDKNMIRKLTRRSNDTKFISVRDAIKIVIQHDKEQEQQQIINAKQKELVGRCKAMIAEPSDEEWDAIKSEFYTNRDEQLERVNQYAVQFTETSDNDEYGYRATSGELIRKTQRGIDALSTTKIIRSITRGKTSGQNPSGITFKRENLHVAWRGWDGKVTHTKPEYHPDGTPSRDGGVYNTFRGWGAKPVKGNCSILTSFIKQQICNNNDEQYSYLMNLFAQMIQFPTEKIGVNIVLPSGNKQGVGKGTLYRILRELFGFDNCVQTSVGKVLERFNSSIDDKFIVWFDEATVTESVHVENLKRLTSESTIEVDKKGSPAVMKPSFHRVFIATDKMLGVKIDAADRRSFVPDIAEANTQPPEYWRIISRAINDRSQINALMYELQKRDISDVDFTVIPTKAKQVQAQQTGGIQKRFVEACHDADYGLNFIDGTVSAKDLKTFHESFTRTGNDKASSAYKACKEEFEAIFGKAKPKRVNSKVTRVYHTGTRYQAWQAMADYYGYGDMENPNDPNDTQLQLVEAKPHKGSSPIIFTNKHGKQLELTNDGDQS